MDGRSCTDLYDHSHVDPDRGLVRFIYFRFRVGAVRKFMETASSQRRNSWLLHLDRGPDHIAHDAKNEKNYMAPNPPFVVCAVRACDGPHIDRWQRRW